MKKVLLFLVLLLFPIFVYAKEYEVKDIDLKISFDDDWYVFTRDNIKDNELLDDFNVTYEYIDDIFKTNSIYVDAMPKDISIEFFVMVVPTPGMNNLSNYPDGLLEKDFKKELEMQLKNKFKDISIKFTTINGIKYAEASFYDPNAQAYLYKYYTVINAKGYNFQIQSDKKITESEKQILRKIVESSNVKVNILYKNESKEVQEEIKKYENKNNGRMIRIIVYIVVGALAAFFGGITKGMKSKQNM